LKYPTDKIVSITEGAGAPAILLLHGWGGDENTLAAISRPLAAHRRTVRIALPGFGSSPEPLEPWGSKEYAEVVAEWMEINGLKGADLVGHSHGGRVAIRLAASRPDLVGSLVLIDSAGLPPRRSVGLKLKLIYGRILKAAAKLIGGEFARKVEASRQKLGSADWQAASPVMRGTLIRVIPEDLSTEMKSLRMPVLLIWGSKDTATPLWMGQRMNKLIANSKLEVLDGAGHYSFLERTGEVVSLLWNHLGLPKAW